MINPKLRCNRFSGIFRVMVVVFSAAALVGCGNQDMSDLKAYVAKVKATPKKRIEPLPEIKTVATFVFEPEGLRNPFTPSVSHDQTPQPTNFNGIRPNLIRAREELESFSLDSLRMVGTLDISNKLWGLIKASDGTIHRVRDGNYMGRNHGKILRVVESKVELVEIVTDAPGSWRERPASIALAE